MRLQQVEFKKPIHSTGSSVGVLTLDNKYFNSSTWFRFNSKTVPAEDFIYNLEILNDSYRIIIDGVGTFEGRLSDIITSMALPLYSDYALLELEINNFKLNTVFTKSELGLLDREILQKLLRYVPIIEENFLIIKRWIAPENLMLIEDGITTLKMAIRASYKYKLPVMNKDYSKRTVKTGISKITELRSYSGRCLEQWLIRGIDTYIGEHEGVYYSFDGKWKSKSLGKAEKKNIELTERFGNSYDFQY